MILPEEALHTSATFSQEIAGLAASHGVTTRLIQGRRTLVFADGNDEWVVSPHPGDATDKAHELFEQFLILQQQRALVVAGVQAFLRDPEWQVETSSSGVWHCVRGERSCTLHLDFRLTQRLLAAESEQVLAALLAQLEHCREEREATESPRIRGLGPWPRLEAAPELVADQILRHSVRRSPPAQGSTLKRSWNLATCRQPFCLPPLPEPTTREQIDRLADELLAACRDQRASAHGETPHWSVLWRNYQRDEHWFSSHDRTLTRDWLVHMAHRELSQGAAADTLSAIEVCMSQGERCCSERADQEKALWLGLGQRDVETCFLLLSHFYEASPDARALLDAEDETGLRDRALIQQRHFPTLRRVAIEFAEEWQRCERDGVALTDAWILEQDNFRRMGPIWARDFMGQPALTRLQDACCTAALTMDAAELEYHLRHLVLWAADFYWLDVLSALRQNRHFLRVLDALQRHLATLALAWSSIRPDPLMAQFAIWLMRSERPLDSLAGATVWRRCRQ